MENFTPISSLAGGVLIGIAAVILMGVNGRIAGISGITAGLLSREAWQNDWFWRVSFVVGLVAAPAILIMTGVTIPSIHFVSSVPVMAIAGVLVGFGTVLGNGCTSGHGVCGVSRLSMRSIIATAIFMTAGVATVFVTRHAFAVLR